MTDGVQPLVRPPIGMEGLVSVINGVGLIDCAGYGEPGM